LYKIYARCAFSKKSVAIYAFFRAAQSFLPERRNTKFPPLPAYAGTPAGGEKKMLKTFSHFSVPCYCFLLGKETKRVGCSKIFAVMFAKKLPTFETQTPYV
jgi:hypothetical protein